MSVLRILSGGATHGLVEKARAAFEKDSGHRIEGTFGAVGAMKARLLAGEPADLMILSRALIDELARDGKVVLLPHMGSATIEGRIDMGEKVIVNIKTFMDGHKPPDRVLPSML